MVNLSGRGQPRWWRAGGILRALQVLSRPLRPPTNVLALDCPDHQRAAEVELISEYIAWYSG
jgi:hypothetical protein